jgi:hypothetical protein
VSFGPVALRSLDNSKAPDEGFRLRLVGRTQQLAMGKELRPCQVVKERGYLVDNLCCSIISRRGNEMQGESGWALKTVPEMGNVKCANCVGLRAQDDLRLSLRNVTKPRLALEERVLRA